MTFLLKLVGLPLIALLTLMEWLGIFALGISQFITNKLAALIFFIACCCLLFGKVTFREAAAMFAGSFCIFALPYAAERILERISDLGARLNYDGFCDKIEASGGNCTMALQDTVTKQYMSKGEIFADAFNYLIYSGRQVIRPDQLSEMDTTQIAIPFAPQEQGKPETTQKYRDVLKTLSVKKDKTCTYLVLGIENQSRVHYAMPIRNMLYDVLQYEKQVRELAAKHRQNRDAENADEYLSGLTKDDRLIPVITLVINFGDKKWDGPLTFHEMLTEQPEEVLALLPDYKVFLIDPMAMESEDFDKLHSSLREVLHCIKVQKDKQEMRELLQTDDRFARLDRDAAMVIRTMTNTKFKIDDHSEVVNMCEAIQGLIDDSIRSEKKETALRMVELGFSTQQIAQVLKLSEDDVLKLIQK